jgi:plasmid stabilization system protein ParE
VTYRVRFTKEARADLKVLLGALALRDLSQAEKARKKIDAGLKLLKDFPFTCRKAQPENPFLRELVIQFGSSGFIALFEIEDADFVTILAFRHQRQDDYF